MKYPLIVFLYCCSVASSAQIFEGTYEQQPSPLARQMDDGELKEKYLEKFEKDRITLKIIGQELRVSMFNGDDAASLPFTQYDKTLVAGDANEMYWVLFQKDKDTLHATGTTFKRIEAKLPQ